MVSPSTLNKRPSVLSPTGTLIPAPVAITSISRCKPSLDANIIHLTVLFPICCATSITHRLPLLSTSRASLMYGRSLFSNSTSITGPMTCTILPLFIVILLSYRFFFFFCDFAPATTSVISCVIAACLTLLY